MEDRVQQFQIDAQRPRDPKTPKEIERLRKFLFKNQEYRFTEREQSHLFSAVQAHYAAHADLPDASAREPALELIEDALKMPFTVFTTSQKKTFLKWHAKLTGSEADHGKSPAAGAASSAERTEYQVIDATETMISCMTDDGDVVDLDVKASAQDLVAKLRAAFDDGKAVVASLDSGRQAILSFRVDGASD
ncbi:hypothetical protein PLESTB_000670200 [Pleodorina starrii]|uniref:Translation initiation factor 5A C-terminal domain-containing protein n=1 Tax=Pleodorina starrii TaxID=330485 RepID=A0A9W6BII5_9CHLO|nr:hypothetical protein PLESTM_001671000 [Pleodorina starrii]GLC52802.1 hypothetical protein PLESTB_000670200 [Pleodorina starrii]GLC65852.1 hypothetical protein PLESTF_000350300 [Pleodorina starrii]